MKSRYRLIAIIASAVILLAVLTIVIVNAVKCSGNATVSLTSEKALQFYDNALTNALSAEDFTLDITTTKNTSTDENQYSFSSHQIVTYDDYATDNMLAQSQETMNIGQNETTITESFVDNKVYFTIDGAAFTGSMPADAFIDRFAPVALIDKTLYSTISATKGPDGIFIQFSDPEGAESWCIPAGAEMISADGTVQLTTDGQLLQSIYHITYSEGTETKDLTITVVFTPITEAKISIPTSKSSATAHYLDAARDLEVMYGYLLQSDKMYAQIDESINCQAGGILRTQTTALEFASAEAGLDAAIETVVSITDYSDGGSTVTNTQTETFHDNAYSISTNGGEAIAQPDITAEQTLNYCQDLLVKNVILPGNIASVNTVVENDVITLQIVGTEELAQLIGKNACKTLYDNPDLLNDLASSYKTNLISCYYKLDRSTGLPITAGLEYSGEHTIEGFAYTLTYSAKIEYGKPEVNTEPVPDETTENTQATEKAPLQ